jgi:FKBP-type peptidyl-prolyl cis-trans isomerase FkpA
MKLTLKLIAAGLCAVILAACGAAANPNPIPGPVIDPTTQPPGYSATDNTVGTGAVVANGDIVTVTYTLWLYSTTAANHEGVQIQTNVGGTPLNFVVGAGQVISGFDQGVVGMAAGGSRTLVLPYSLGYGPNPVFKTDSTGAVVKDASGNSVVSIPAYSGLVYSVQVLFVTKAS